MHCKFFLGINHKVNLWERLEISSKWAMRRLGKKFQDPNLYIKRCKGPLIQGVPRAIAKTTERVCHDDVQGIAQEKGETGISWEQSYPLLRMKSLRSCFLYLPFLILIPSAPNVHSSTSSQLSKVTHKAKYSRGWWANEILLSISLSSGSLPL